MSTFDNGVISGTGFSWMRVPDFAVSQVKPTPEQMARPGTVILVGRTKDIDGLIVSPTMQTEPWKIAYRFGRQSFLPFDAQALFPDDKIVWSETRVADLDAWVRTMVQVPDEIDVRFQQEPYGDTTLVAVARTLRRGRLTQVRYPVARDVPLARFLEGLWPRIVEESPRPPEGHDVRQAPEHLVALLAHLDAVGHDKVVAWIAKCDADEALCEKQGRKAEAAELYLHGNHLPGAGIDSAKLKTHPRTNSIRGEVEFSRTNKITDDETGSTVHLNAELPLAVTTQMRGRRMGDLFDKPWMANMTIRTNPEAGGSLSFRAFSRLVPFRLSAPVEVDEAEVVRRLKRAFFEGARWGDEPTGLWTEFDPILQPVFDAIEPRLMADVVTVLEEHTRVDLERFGFPGWKIKTVGPRIVVDEHPAMTVADLASARYCVHPAPTT